MWWKRNQPQIHITPYGKLVKIGLNNWEGYFPMAGMLIHVYCNDVDGKPNPDFLRKISQIESSLSLLLARAKQVAPSLSQPHYFCTLYEGEDASYDFALGFSFREDIRISDFDVYFKGDEAIRSDDDPEIYEE